jgi:hypothetical protein
VWEVPGACSARDKFCGDFQGRVSRVGRAGRLGTIGDPPCLPGPPCACLPINE